MTLIIRLGNSTNHFVAALATAHTAKLKFYGEKTISGNLFVITNHIRTILNGIGRFKLYKTLRYSLL